MAYQFVIFLFFVSTQAFSAACCGGGVGLPNIITGDYKAQYGFSYANKAVTHTTSETGDFLSRDKNNKEIVKFVQNKM